jgi:hypothetical protein
LGITNAPTLKHFDLTRETEIFTDASSYAIGGWLAQRYPDGLHPVFFWSRRMLSAEMAYPVHEQELLAIVKMCGRAAHMLRGTRFVANTDHHALIYLQKQVNLSGRQVRWIMELQLYDIRLKYVTGKLNPVADFLTRNPTVMPKCGDCGKVIVKTITTNPIQ